MCGIVVTVSLLLTADRYHPPPRAPTGRGARSIERKLASWKGVGPPVVDDSVFAQGSPLSSALSWRVSNFPVTTRLHLNHFDPTSLQLVSEILWQTRDCQKKLVNNGSVCVKEHWSTHNERLCIVMGLVEVLSRRSALAHQVHSGTV